MRVWDPAAGRQLGQPPTGHNIMWAVALSADGRLALAGGLDGTVRVWDPATGRRLGQPLTGHNGWVEGVALSADGRLAVSGGREGRIRVLDTRESRCLLETVVEAPVTSIAVAQSTRPRFQLVDGKSSEVLDGSTLTAAN